MCYSKYSNSKTRIVLVVSVYLLRTSVFCRSSCCNAQLASGGVVCRAGMLELYFAAFSLFMCTQCCDTLLLTQMV
jgi:hypothetical protein